MQTRSKMYRLMITALLATAVAAPVASAMPTDNGGYTSYTSKAYTPSSAGKAHTPSSAQTEMHASTVRPPAWTDQDLRSEGSIPSSRAAAPTHAVEQDLRTENTADPSRARSRSCRGRRSRSPPKAMEATSSGPPRWP